MKEQELRELREGDIVRFGFNKYVVVKRTSKKGHVSLKIALVLDVEQEDAGGTGRCVRQTAGETRRVTTNRRIGRATRNKSPFFFTIMNCGIFYL